MSLIEWIIVILLVAVGFFLWGPLSVIIPVVVRHFFRDFFLWGAVAGAVWLFLPQLLSGRVPYGHERRHWLRDLFRH